MLTYNSKIKIEKNKPRINKLPNKLKLDDGVYEVQFFFDKVNEKNIEVNKEKLTFSNHKYTLENPKSNFNREEIYNDFEKLKDFY